MSGDAGAELIERGGIDALGETLELAVEFREEGGNRSVGGGGASFTGGVQEVLLGVEVVGVGECREKQAKTEVFGGIAIGRELRNGELGRSGQAVGGVGGEKWREVGLKCGRSGEFAQGVEEGVPSSCTPEWWPATTLAKLR